MELANGEILPVALKSYRRVFHLRDCTYRQILLRYHFVLEHVHIFVSSEWDQGAYSAAFPQCNVHRVPLGIQATDNAITDFFHDGQPFVNMIDSVINVHELHNTSLRRVADLKAALESLYLRGT